MDVKLFLLLPFTRSYFICTLLGIEAVLQGPVCKEEAQGRQVPGVWARQVLGGGWLCDEGHTRACAHAPSL